MAIIFYRFCWVFAAASLLVSGQGDSAQMAPNGVPILIQPNYELPVSTIDNPHAEGQLAWPDDNKNGGLMPPFPIVLWATPSSDVICGRIPQLLGGHIASATYAYKTSYAKVGDTVTYECNRGRAMVGLPQIKCLSNGEWSRPSTHCSRFQISSANQPNWLPTATQNYDEILWPEWFTTSARNALETEDQAWVPETPSSDDYPRYFDGADSPLASTQASKYYRKNGNKAVEESTTSTSKTIIGPPLVIRIVMNFSSLLPGEAQPERKVGLSTTTTQNATSEADGIISNKAAFIGIVVGSCLGGITVFGVASYLLLRVLRKLSIKAHGVFSGDDEELANLPPRRQQLQTAVVPPPPYQPTGGRRISTVTPLEAKRRPATANALMSVDRTAQDPNRIEDEPSSSQPLPTPQPTSPPPYNTSSI